MSELIIENDGISSVVEPQGELRNASQEDLQKFIELSVLMRDLLHGLNDVAIFAEVF